MAKGEVPVLLRGGVKLARRDLVFLLLLNYAFVLFIAINDYHNKYWYKKNLQNVHFVGQISN